MSASLSPALSALLSQGEEAISDERNEKMEAATRSFSKLMASVQNGTADPSVLDDVINGSFGSGSSSSSSSSPSSALPAPAPVSKPNTKATELASLIEASPESENAATFLLTILRGVTDQGQRVAIQAIANKASGYEVDGRTGELKAVKERDDMIRDLQAGLTTIAGASGVGSLSGESYKDHGKRIADEFKKLSAASPSSSSATPKTSAMPKSVDTDKAKTAIAAAKDLIEKGKPGKGMFSKPDEWVINGTKKDKVLTELKEAEKSL